MTDKQECDRELLDRLIPKIRAQLGKEFKDARYTLSSPNDILFMSETFFINFISNETEDNKEESYSVVVKRPPQNEIQRQMFNSDSQFHNEILFYRKYANDGNFPRLIYSDESSPKDTVLVLESVKNRGYAVSQWKYDVPMEYTVAAMRELGRFHGKGYVMKEQESDKFLAVIHDIQESRFDNKLADTFGMMINQTATRSVKYLRDHGSDPDFCNKVETFLDKSYQNVMMPSTVPDEPLSTLCHGDFTLNNMLFSTENGEVKAMLIDFALMRYGTPAIDLSTYLCLSCSGELARENTERILKVYHDSLRSYLSEHGVSDAKYSYEAILEDYRKKGLFGFVIASFYLAMLMEENTTIGPEELLEMDPQVQLEQCLTRGGDKVSKKLADMLMNLVDFGCLKNVL